MVWQSWRFWCSLWPARESGKKSRKKTLAASHQHAAIGRICLDPMSIEHPAIRSSFECDCAAFRRLSSLSSSAQCNRCRMTKIFTTDHIFARPERWSVTKRDAVEPLLCFGSQWHQKRVQSVQSLSLFICSPRGLFVWKCEEVWSLKRNQFRVQTQTEFSFVLSLDSLC